MGLDNNIPEGWKVTNLESCLSSLIDYRGKTPKKSKTGILALSAKSVKMGYIDYNQAYYISPETYKNFMVRGFPKKGDILMTTEAPLGCIAKLDRENITVAQRLLTLRGKSNLLDNDYLMFYLMSRIGQYELKSRASGSTVQGIKRTEFSRVNIILPPLAEQKAIANVLTAFDDKIELLQAQNKTLETIAKTIFKEWFGKYQIGDELPEGWRVTKVNEFVKSSIGGDYGKETIEGDYTEETICLRGTDLPDMKMGTPKKAPIRFLKASKLERCKLENGDIVVEISGGTENQSTGRAMYINEKILSSAKHPMTCVNFCRIIRPLKIEYSYFLHSLFDYLYTRKVFFNWENGTTGIKNLNLNALLEDFDLFIPKNEDSILDFNNNVQAIFNKIQTNNSQVQSLTKTRDTLLPKLMSGQVRVNNTKNA